jgi:hypothetical protein
MPWRMGLVRPMRLKIRDVVPALLLSPDSNSNVGPEPLL